jgi:hypothetical protein
MGLKAWRLRGEILLSDDLRQKIAADITKEIGLYQT